MKFNTTLMPLVAILLATANPLAAQELQRGEWSVRLILTSETGGLEDPYNTLGQRLAATAGPDAFDLPELGQTWPGTYLSIIFYRPEWGVEKDSYHTDFHPVARGAADEWTFEVRSDDPYRDLSLTWVGENTTLRSMSLVDLQENVEVKAVIRGETQVYNFRMNGPVREFAWRLREHKTSGTTAAAAGSTLNARSLSANSADASPAQANSVTAKAPKADQSSDWIPLGWGQGAGDDPSLPVGLPADPFGD